MSEYVNSRGETVPRTSEIIKFIQDNEGIINWANSLGFKRINYKEELSKMADIGTYAHEMINNYINNFSNEVKELPLYLKSKGENALSGFIQWWNDITPNNKVEIVKSEYKMCGERYGGTLDLLVKINDELYLVDFKTSSTVKLTHFIQLVAYRELLKEVDDIDNIKGLIVVKSSRTKYNYYEEKIIDINKNKLFIDNCIKLFDNAIITRDNYIKLSSLYSELK